MIAPYHYVFRRKVFDHVWTITVSDDGIEWSRGMTYGWLHKVPADEGHTSTYFVRMPRIQALRLAAMGLRNARAAVGSLHPTTAIHWRARDLRAGKRWDWNSGWTPARRRAS